MTRRDRSPPATCGGSPASYPHRIVRVLERPAPMSKFTTALLSTGVGIALIIGVKAQSAGSPRSALDDARHLRAGRVSSVAPPSSSAAASSKTGGSGSGAGPSGRYTGSVTETPYGPVQVRARARRGEARRASPCSSRPSAGAARRSTPSPFRFSRPRPCKAQSGRHRCRLRCDLHLRRLRAVASGGPRLGRSVTPCAPPSNTSWAPSSPSPCPDLTDAALFRTGGRRGVRPAAACRRRLLAVPARQPGQPHPRTALLSRATTSPGTPHGRADPRGPRPVRGLKRDSGGAFDAWAVGDPPGFDPCGAVKGWAAERAAGACRARTDPARPERRRRRPPARERPGDPWRVGARRSAPPRRGPGRPGGRRGRGGHLRHRRARRPRLRPFLRPPGHGPGPGHRHRVRTCALADGYATAALAMADGPRGSAGDPRLAEPTRRRRKRLPGHDRRPHGGRRWMTDGMAALLRPPRRLSARRPERQG